ALPERRAAARGGRGVRGVDADVALDDGARPLHARHVRRGPRAVAGVGPDQPAAPAEGADDLEHQRVGERRAGGRGEAPSASDRSASAYSPPAYGAPALPMPMPVPGYPNVAQGVAGGGAPGTTHPGPMRQFAGGSQPIPPQYSGMLPPFAAQAVPAQTPGLLPLGVQQIARTRQGD